MKTLILATTIIAMSPVIGDAQSALTGKWQGETRSGSRIVLDVKATETTVNGTLTVDGQATTIVDGKVAKNRFTFEAQEPITGELAGDQVTIWLDRQGPSSAAVLKRVKEKGLTGKWQGQTQNGTGIVLDLTATGTTLTGTLTRRDQTVTIAEGTVSKNRFTFRATLEDQTEAFTGELAGDELKVWLNRQGPERAAVLKRRSP
jgi:hypothetical protein